MPHRWRKPTARCRPLHKLGHKTCCDSPVSGMQRALMMLVETSEEFLRREQGRQDHAEQARMKSGVPGNEAQS
jgi:hypothetical protein